MQMHKVIGSLWRQRRMGTRNEPCGAPQKSIYPQGKQKVHKEYINDIKQLKSSVRLWELEEVNSEAWQLLHFNFHFSQTLQQLISADLHSLNLRSNQQNNLQLLRSIGKLFMPKQMLWLTEKFFRISRFLCGIKLKNPKSDVSLIAAKKATSSRKIKMDNDEPFSDTIKVWIAQEKVTLNIGIRFWHSAGNKEVEPKKRHISGILGITPRGGQRLQRRLITWLTHSCSLLE